MTTMNNRAINQATLNTQGPTTRRTARKAINGLMAYSNIIRAKLMAMNMTTPAGRAKEPSMAQIIVNSSPSDTDTDDTEEADAEEADTDADVDADTEADAIADADTDTSSSGQEGAAVDRNDLLISLMASRPTAPALLQANA